jgi:hypothetical protein
MCLRQAPEVPSSEKVRVWAYQIKLAQVRLEAGIIAKDSK